MKLIAWEQALATLKAGNKRFVEEQWSPTLNDVERRQALLEGQAPYAAVLACSDSRVIPEVIFDARLGDLFVLRVAGNVLDPLVVLSLELAVKELGTSLIVVLGHEHCKAVGVAVAKGSDTDAYLQPLVEKITPALGERGQETNKAAALVAGVKNNAIYQANKLVAESDILQKAVGPDLRICPAYYELASGQVHWL